MPRIDLIEGYARMGYSNAEIAEKLHIVPATLDKYVRLADEDERYAKIRDALQRGREQTDILVENALLKRAIGYKHKEIVKERKIDQDGNYELVITKVTQKEIPPDVGAATYWLEHRAQKRWNTNPIAEANEVLANQAILKIADLINNPVPIREPEDPTKEYEELEKKNDTEKSETTKVVKRKRKFDD